MREVTIELSHYNDLRDRSKEAENLRKEIEKLKEKHESEIHQLKEEGKIGETPSLDLSRTLFTTTNPYSLNSNNTNLPSGTYSLKAVLNIGNEYTQTVTDFNASFLGITPDESWGITLVNNQFVLNIQ